jgi:hypothetical protein
MREDALTARVDEHGEQVLVVLRPITFTLIQTARAMHAVVDPHMTRLTSRQRVGRNRVREVLRHIAIVGWPRDFNPDPDRVDFWRRWLIQQAVFTDTDAKRRDPWKPGLRDMQR